MAGHGSSLTTIGRVIAVTNALALPGLAIWNLTAPGSVTSVSAYCICTGILLGIVEIQTLCTCAKFCRIIATYTKWVTGYWIGRAFIHFGIAAGGLAMYILFPPNLVLYSRPLSALLCFIACIVTGLLYVAGKVWKKEEDPSPVPIDEIKAGLSKVVGEAALSSVTAKASGFGRFFSRGGNSGGDASSSSNGSSSGADKAPSKGMSLFGSGASAKASSPSGFYGEDAEAGASAAAPAAEKASLFTGGSLFGNNSSSSGNSSSAVAPSPSAATVAAAASSKASKYGMGGADDEANPFLS